MADRTKQDFQLDFYSYQEYKIDYELNEENRSYQLLLLESENNHTRKDM